jgi:beta-galactosidase
VVTIAVVDGRGRTVPVAANALAFEIDGPGRIIGVGNGDPSSHEPDTFVGLPAVRTRPLDDWRWHKVADAYAPDLPETGAKFDDAGWDKADVRRATGPLGANDKAVFRTRFTVSAQELASSGLELWFGKIEGDGSVFLDGRKLARTGDARAPSVYDVKALLHPGEHSVAVSLANWGEAAGLNNGVKLRLIDKPSSVEWRRSVFNGLAQLIVRTTGEPGTIKLTAKSPALVPATTSLSSIATVRRPSLP